MRAKKNSPLYEIVMWVSCITMLHNTSNKKMRMRSRFPYYSDSPAYQKCEQYTSISGAHNYYDVKLIKKMVISIYVTLLGNILLRSIVVSVLIRLINGYSVTDGTWLNLFLKIEVSGLLVDALHVVLGIAPSPCDDSPKGHTPIHQKQLTLIPYNKSTPWMQSPHDSVLKWVIFTVSYDDSKYSYLLIQLAASLMVLNRS